MIDADPSLHLFLPPLHEEVRLVLTHLLRSGEEAALVWPIELRTFHEAQASWWEFVRERYLLWWALTADGRFDTIPIGWTYAAVRLFGGDALVALWDVQLDDWPGTEAAEAHLRKVNEGTLRERRPWERG